MRAEHGSCIYICSHRHEVLHVTGTTRGKNRINTCAERTRSHFFFFFSTFVDRLEATVNAINCTVRSCRHVCSSYSQHSVHSLTLWNWTQDLLPFWSTWKKKNQPKQARQPKDICFNDNLYDWLCLPHILVKRIFHFGSMFRRGKQTKSNERHNGIICWTNSYLVIQKLKSFFFFYLSFHRVSVIFSFLLLIPSTWFAYANRLVQMKRNKESGRLHFAEACCLTSLNSNGAALLSITML